MPSIQSSCTQFAEIRFDGPVRSTDPKQQPILVAHQGVQGFKSPEGFYPPNSLAAIKLAFGWAQAVEFDIHMADHEDGKGSTPVVIHPEGYFHFVNSDGMKNGLPLPVSFEAVRDITVRGVPLTPTLLEVLDLAVASKAQKRPFTELQVELKGPDTTEPVVKMLQERVRAGQLTYDDFIVCTFCYPNEPENRLEVARRLDPKMRLMLTVRGGDFTADPFDSLEEVYEFCKRHQINALDIARKNLTREIVRRSHALGIHQTCHHARTTDEVRIVEALGVDSVRADHFKGAHIGDYPRSMQMSPELFDALKEMNFFHASDWIWELGWKAQPAIDSAVHSSITQSQCAALLECNSDAAYIAGDTHASLCRLKNETLSLSNPANMNIGAENLTVADMSVLGSKATLADLMKEANITACFQANLAQLALETDLFPQLKRFWQEHNVQDDISARLFSYEQVVMFCNDNAQDALLLLSPKVGELTPKEFTYLEQFSEQFLIRLGRLHGQLAFETVSPIRSQKEQLNTVIFTPLASIPTFERTCREQYNAQLLRAGKQGKLHFSPQSEKAEESVVTTI